MQKFINAFIALMLLPGITKAQQLADAGYYSLVEDSRTDSITDNRISREGPPNFIIIFTDDQGYQDVGSFGSQNIKTPHLDKMAEEGMRFISFYAQTICGPSRAAVITGCYPMRVATRKNLDAETEHHPRLHEEEITFAEILKEVGYSTAAIGKWDLAGHTQHNYDQDLLPTRQGFDYFFGTPSSNDAVAPLLRNEEIIEQEADMSTLTRRYTDETIEFIKNNKDKPFLAYLAHSMPHVRLEASEQFRGKSAGGLYGDVVEEIDWNVGRIIKTLQDLDLDESTYVFFMSDNGPWLLPGKWRSLGGNAEPLRGGKTSVWEGGFRVPGIMWAPGRIPAGTVSNEIASTLDILPTLAKLSGGNIPDDRIIDGNDLSMLLHGQKEEGPNDAFYYYQRTRLGAVRVGNWKLHLPRPAEEIWGEYIAKENNKDIEQPLLYNLKKDIGEQNNIANQHPEVVEKLLEYAEEAREDIGDFNRMGKGQRFFDKEPRRPDLN